jgi:hypothetical protein
MITIATLHHCLYEVASKGYLVRSYELIVDLNMGYYFPGVVHIDSMAYRLGDRRKILHNHGA